MKTIILVLFSFLAFHTHSTGQSKAPNRIFKRGQTDFHLGVGLVPSYFMDGATIRVLPLSLEVNRMLGDHFSLGAFAGYSSSNGKPILTSDGIPASLVNNHYQFGLKGGIHITKWDNLDWYGGFQLGFNLNYISAGEVEMKFMEKHLGVRPKNSKVTYTGFVGGRHAITPKWSIFGEAGFGISLFTAGIGMRL